jgi:hypothetical protein
LGTQWGSHWELGEHCEEHIENMRGTQCEELHENTLRTMQIQYPYPPPTGKKPGEPKDITEQNNIVDGRDLKCP